MIWFNKRNIHFYPLIWYPITNTVFLIKDLLISTNDDIGPVSISPTFEINITTFKFHLQ